MGGSLFLCCLIWLIFMPFMVEHLPDLFQTGGLIIPFLPIIL
jgi:hypothetical protein